MQNESRLVRELSATADYFRDLSHRASKVEKSHRQAIKRLKKAEQNVKAAMLACQRADALGREVLGGQIVATSGSVSTISDDSENKMDWDKWFREQQEEMEKEGSAE